NPFWLDTARAGHPGCLDDTPPGGAGERLAASGRRQLVRNDLKDLRPKSRRMAHLLDRPGNQFLSAADWPAMRQRYRAGGQDRAGRADAMELYEGHAEFISEFISLVGRAIPRRRQSMAFGGGGAGSAQGHLIHALCSPR